jgi:hypothetical protein
MSNTNSGKPVQDTRIGSATYGQNIAYVNNLGNVISTQAQTLGHTIGQVSAGGQITSNQIGTPGYGRPLGQIPGPFNR